MFLWSTESRPTNAPLPRIFLVGDALRSQATATVVLTMPAIAGIVALTLDSALPLPAKHVAPPPGSVPNREFVLRTLSTFRQWRAFLQPNHRLRRYGLGKV